MEKSKRNKIIIASVIGAVLLVALILLLTMCHRSGDNGNPSDTDGAGTGVQTSAGTEDTQDAESTNIETPNTETESSEIPSTDFPDTQDPENPDVSTPATSDIPPDVEGTDDHEHEYEVSTIAVTCAKDGYTLHKCTVCGKTYSDNIVKALGHDYDAWTTVKAATCDANGSRTHTCKTCGHVATETISATGHKWDSGKVTSTGTSCASPGVTTYTCTVCGKTKVEQTKASHTWGAWQWEEYEYTQKLDLPPWTYKGIGHDKYHVCSKCGLKEYDTSIKKHACNYDNYKTVRTPNCQQTGLVTMTCVVCGHVWEDVSEKDPNMHANMTSKKEHLCDASYEYNALDVEIIECKDCGVKEYLYECDSREPFRGKKFRVAVGIGDGDSYELSSSIHSDKMYQHPTWQTVVRDFQYDNEGYVIAFTVIWVDMNGTRHSEVLDCSGTDALYKYFAPALIERNLGKTGCWMLEIRGDHLVGHGFVYNG